MLTGIFVKVLSITLLIAVGIVLILGIGTLFKGGSVNKKYLFWGERKREQGCLPLRELVSINPYRIPFKFLNI